MLIHFNIDEIKEIAKSCVNEAIQESDFGENVKGDLTLDDIKAGVPLYHRPSDSKDSNPLAVINNLMKYGFSREYTGSNGGNMYGPGVYNVYTLRSSNEKARSYGKYIVKSYLLGGYKDFLIFNRDMARSVYGDKYTLRDQIYHLFPQKDAERILSKYHSIFEYNHSTGMENGMNDNSHLYIKTAHIAVTITDGESAAIKRSKIRGIIYSGGHDGECAFVRNFSDVVPYSYSSDNGKTWTVGITEELIWRAGHNTDVEAKVKHAVDDEGKKMFSDTAERSINGFVIVYKDNLANYFDVAKNGLISDVWFDYAGNFQPNEEYNDNLTAEVQYHNHNLLLIKDGNNFVISDPDEGPMCYLNDLPNVL